LADRLTDSIIMHVVGMKAIYLDGDPLKIRLTNMMLVKSQEEPRRKTVIVKRKKKLRARSG
jgi:hypothetical protein